MKKIISVLLIFSLFLFSACSQDQANEQHENHSETSSNLVMGDIREETTSIEELPTFLDDKTEEIKMLYTAVANSKDLLEYIPCYCGCGESVHHKDNYDCFVHENHEDGSLVWDDHATKCKACVDIAIESIIEYKEGKPIKEIRQMIDEKYKEGYAEPTPTPLPKM